jgi:serine/threonine protein kinase
MRAERFRQIRNLFDAALERSPDTRNAFLQEACHGDEELLVEVGRLLAAHGEPTAWIDESVLGEPLPRLEGRRVGAYEILRQLGEGGMGSVYLAVRADGAFRKQFALKLVRPAAATEDTMRRFQREREILASLDHPNIARIVDGGTTEDGLPYLVMDYVEGEPIDAYCNRHRLDLTARLQLFREVCSAVQYAHDRHVVHRDLKPTNILVTRDGVVKLLDFGIAKLGGQQLESAAALTRTDMCLMTPEYASPEQVAGGPTTPSTDVYSLGVVLYELMTGKRPYRMRSRVIHEVVRVICEETPARPSVAVAEKDPAEAVSDETASRLRAASPIELKRRLSGDIDCILLKALEKDPPRRYPSARSFSEDVRLHLEGLEVEARRGAWVDAAGRFAARYAWLLIAVAALSLATYNGLFRIPEAVVLAVWTFIGAGVHAASARLFGRNYVRRRAPRIAMAVIVGVLVVVAALTVLPRLFPDWTAILAMFAVLLGAWNLFVFYRALLWLGRGRRLGRLLRDVSPPAAGLRRERAVDGARRAFVLGPASWVVLPMLLLFLFVGVGMVSSGFWGNGAMDFSVVLFLSLYVWMDSNPASRRSPLGRPSRLGPIWVVICLGLIAYFAMYVGKRDYWSLGLLYLLVLWMLPLLLISGRNEIRELGLAWSGRLISWSEVLSYSWTQDTGLVEVLRLRIRKGARSSRELRIPMLPQHRPQVDDVLDRKISEWPDPARVGG